MGGVLLPLLPAPAPFAGRLGPEGDGMGRAPTYFVPVVEKTYRVETRRARKNNESFLPRGVGAGSHLFFSTPWENLMLERVCSAF